MKTIKVVKSFEDALIAAFETGNMKYVEISEEGRIKIYGLHRSSWPEGKEATEPTDYGTYKAGIWNIPDWALDNKEIENIPVDLKTIYELLGGFNCKAITCQECVFNDHTNGFCMITQIRQQTRDKYPGPWK